MRMEFVEDDEPPRYRAPKFMSVLLRRVILGAKTENGRTYIRTKYVNDEMGAWTAECWVCLYDLPPTSWPPPWMRKRMGGYMESVL